jgi:hypothetical protein
LPNTPTGRDEAATARTGSLVLDSLHPFGFRRFDDDFESWTIDAWTVVIS